MTAADEARRLQAAQDVAPHLPGKWHVVNDKWPQLVREDGFTLDIYRDWGDADRWAVSVSGSSDYVRYNQVRPQITQAYIRPPKALAGDIVRRLLTEESEEFWRTVEAGRIAHEEYEANRAATRERLGACPGVTSSYRDGDLYVAGHGHLSVYAGKASLDVHNVSADKMERILTILAES